MSILIKPSASPSGWGRSSAICSRAAAPARATDPTMEPPPSNAGQLVETSKRFARRLLTIGENRFELLMVEVQEERERLLRAILLALGVAAFGLLAGVALTGAIVVLFWEVSPVGGVAGADRPLRGGGGLSLLAAHAAAARLAESSGHPRSTPKGPRMFGKTSHVSPLELRKQLLIAESELNRAQLSEEWQTLRHGLATWPTGPKPLPPGPRRRRCWWPGLRPCVALRPRPPPRSPPGSKGF